MLLASDAPDWMDAMAIKSRPTGNSVDARLRGEEVIVVRPRSYWIGEDGMMLKWIKMSNIMLKFSEALIYIEYFGFFHRGLIEIAN